MAPKTSAEIVDGTERKLEDTGNTNFTAADISAEAQNCLKEISDIKPWVWRHIKTAGDSSVLGTVQSGQSGHLGREIDISDIDDRIIIKETEYPVGYLPRILRKFEVYGDTLFIHALTRPLAGTQNDAAGDVQYLTGTVTFTSGSTAVSGSGTAFTSELEVGYYIAKSGSSNWYRVASITDDTNLVLATACDSDDDGADTAGATRYWYQYVYVWAAKNHYLEATQTDLAGAVKAAHAKGSWQLVVDALGTGTMPKNMTFTIAGVEGLYRIKEDATITTNEATLIIEPRLKGIAPDNAVVTFLPSSLDQRLEVILMELTAGRMAINWVGKARTAVNNAVTAYGLANAAVDSMTTRITTAVTDIGTAQTAASANFSTATTALSNADEAVSDTIPTLLTAYNSGVGAQISTDAGDALHTIDLASDEIDLAVTRVADMKGFLDTNRAANIDDALGEMDTAIDAAVTSQGNIEQYADVVTTGRDPSGVYAQSINANLAAVSANVKQLQSEIQDGYIYRGVVTERLNNSKAFLSEARVMMEAEQVLSVERIREISERIKMAGGAIRTGIGYLEADYRKTASLTRLIEKELQAANSYLNQSSGYFRESTASLNAAKTFNQLTVWGEKKVAFALDELRRYGPSTSVSKAYARY